MSDKEENIENEKSPPLILKTFKIPRYLIELAELNMELRFRTGRFVKKEDFSKYLRNMIEEDWKKNKRIIKILQNKKKRAEEERNKNDNENK